MDEKDNTEKELDLLIRTLTEKVKSMTSKMEEIEKAIIFKSELAYIG